MLAPSPAYPPTKNSTLNIQHSTFKKDESEHLENNSSDSHQHTDRYRYYARSNELHGIKNKRSPCRGKSFINYLIFKALAPPGRLVCVRIYPGCYPGLGASAPSGRVGQNMLKFSYYWSRSWRVKVIKGHYHFQTPKIPVIKVTVIKVIKDFGVQKYPSTSLYLIKKVKSSSPCQQNPSI